MRASALACAGLLAVSRPVPAQTGLRSVGGASDPSPRITVTVGPLIRGGEALGEQTASLRTNAVGTLTPPASTLVRADGRLGAAAGLDVRASVRLGHGLMLETTGRAVRSTLGLALAADPEVPAQVLDAERLSLYTADLALVWQLPLGARGGRLEPLVGAGAGVLRHLHDGRLLADDGQTAHVAGGARWWVRRPARGRAAFGIRADARYEWRRGGTGIGLVPGASVRGGAPSLSLLALVGR